MADAFDMESIRSVFSGFYGEFEGSGRTGAIETPNALIKFDSLATSTVDSYTDHCELFFWQEGLMRYTNPHAANPMATSGTVIAPDVKILIPKQYYVATLQNILISGTLVALISIKKFSNINQTNVIVDQIDYGNCYLEAYSTYRTDYAAFSFRFESRTETIQNFDETGSNKGVGSSKFNWTTNKLG